MHTFDTPSPIALTLTLNLVAATVRITAEDRADTVVDVRPANGSAKSVKAAEQTTVDFTDGHLVVKAPKNLGTLFGNSGQIEVDIVAPAGSTLDGILGAGDLTADGPLGDCKFATGAGQLRFGETGRLHLKTGAGDVTVGRVGGDAEATSGTGTMRIGDIGGSAVIKSSSGGIWLGEITGSAKVNTAAGEINVDRTLAGITAKTAHGRIRIGEAVRGAVTLQTGGGEVEVGIPAGTAAWLDLNAGGAVRNSLDAATGPEESDERVEIRARTYLGDIVIHRS